VASTWLFTCRHGYESAVLDEAERRWGGDVRGRKLLDGLVQLSGDVLDPLDGHDRAQATTDLSWALQVLPKARCVRAPSVNKLANEVAEHLIGALDDERPTARKRGWDRARWSIHTLVPGMLRGQPEPGWTRRLALLDDAVMAILHKRARRLAARRLPTDQLVRLRGADLSAAAGRGRAEERVVLAQWLLESPEKLWHAIAQLSPLPAGGTWPAHLPGGLANVPDDPRAPASSYRKLDEALDAVAADSLVGALAVDLGAAPGGWTRALRRRGARVLAIDRAPLDRELLRDPGVLSRQGDAFAWLPETPVDWMVSDIVAYPERVAELLGIWCGSRWAPRMVVQMKFRGTPDPGALQDALATARGLGYEARARHFFNDKNELTLLVALPQHA
jgi:hypothetical protein